MRFFFLCCANQVAIKNNTTKTAHLFPATPPNKITQVCRTRPDIITLPAQTKTNEHHFFRKNKTTERQQIGWTHTPYFAGASDRNFINLPEDEEEEEAADFDKLIQNRTLGHTRCFSFAQLHHLCGDGTSGGYGSAMCLGPIIIYQSVTELCLQVRHNCRGVSTMRTDSF